MQDVTKCADCTLKIASKEDSHTQLQLTFAIGTIDPACQPLYYSGFPGNPYFVVKFLNFTWSAHIFIKMLCWPTLSGTYENLFGLNLAHGLPICNLCSRYSSA